MLLGATLVFFKFPKREEERKLLAEYQAEDAPSRPEAPPAAEPTLAS